MSTLKTKKLIIVESPTKAKTISKFLGKEYIVKSSFGHLRDLPKSKLGVDTENDFEPEYVINPKSKKQATELKKQAKECDEIILASDEDREGEAISWHLAQLLNLKGFGNGKSEKKYKRIVFHEITKSAIKEALKNPRDIDMNLVDAQQARRILDRLVGYKLSPLLWKKIRYGLSAGRVQSVAVRLIVEKEEEINKFKPEEYWNITAELKKITDKSQESFEARLVKVDSKSIGKLGVKNQDEAEKIKQDLEKANYEIEKITKKETKKNPLPPFTTSTLQQASSNKFGYSAKQTMMIAQQLYEGISLGQKGSSGLITYMRTDSLSLSKSSLESADKYIKAKFGKEYSERRFFKTKSKGAQEAHEAIRPTNPELDAESIKEFLDSKQFKLYELIWQRMVASQMASAIVDSTSIDILAGDKYTLRANGSTIKFEGFLKVHPMKSEEIVLPELTEKEKLGLIKIISEQHFTQPPARFNEASLIKVLEELGIGRPSTYAPTISTIQDRGYIEKIEKRLHPQEIGVIVNKLLVEHFPKIVDVKFTAKMEEDLDKVAENKKDWVIILNDFYKPFNKNLMEKEKEIDKKELTEEKTNEKCEKCKSPMIIKLGRFGKFMACSNYPDCKNTKQLNDKGEIEEPETTNEVCEKCGKPMTFKIGRYGKFLGCSGYPDCKNIKSIVKSTGVQCPECDKGEIVEKKSKAGKIFYACNQYPSCKHALWSKPTGEKCSKCDSLMVYAKNDSVTCSSKECK
ncbi:MAG: type I DNA topoisomerase [Candidatus Pacebacteria bacterium]|nr:type I DNA topoisomerase [Candidatus Paceibacterota bacterium]